MLRPSMVTVYVFLISYGQRPQVFQHARSSAQTLETPPQHLLIRLAAIVPLITFGQPLRSWDAISTALVPRTGTPQQPQYHPHQIPLPLANVSLLMLGTQQTTDAGSTVQMLCS